ncbi:MAG TPA: F0F1 ATP synthase subunit gamma [Candidatus Saccharimonadales bacterium]|nr:F0F1 ATP synthase subunit gamma [Candidatus Saccharimonadales bacterium]
MPQKKIIFEELEALNSLKDLAESYEEIAVVRMQKIRESVLKTRDFLADISDVFVDLKSSYNREVKDLMERIRKGDKGLLSTLQKKDKTLLVYLSSNGGLYGAVTQKTYKLFMQELSKTDKEKTDIVVIGNAGRLMFEGSGANRPYEYFEIPDTSVNVFHIKSLMKKFLQYERVSVFYGKFGNVVKQSPIQTSITGEDIFETETIAQIPREDRFIFEPTLQKIYHFFETQIMANLFSQTLLENQLARHASRVNAMEEALVHIEDETKKLNQQRSRLKHLVENKKQLETISGVVMLMDEM